MNDQDTSQKLANGLPIPPIPQRLCELLKDYPGHLARIQEVLNPVVLDHAKSVPLFEQAIWALEGRTSAFIREAQAELEAAQEAGDAHAIARAEIKEEVMFSARSVNDGLGNLNELRDYLLAHKDTAPWHERGWIGRINPGGVGRGGLHGRPDPRQAWA